VLKRPLVLLQIGVAFGLLTAVGVALTWQRANDAGAQLESAVELTAPVMEREVDVSTPGSWDVVLLPQVVPEGASDRPRVEEARYLKTRLRGAAGELDCVEAPDLGSLDEDDKPMLLRLCSFDLKAAGKHTLTLAYEGRSGPQVRVLFGPEVKRSAEDAARWAFAILLVAFLGGCITVGTLLMGVVMRFRPED
jgi:hypothetical protein